jgi:tetratricopeptide (TPR) repeat protein
MENNKGYRYPGSRPFEDTYHDRRLFFGREKEKDALLQRVLAKQLVVLYAKSGLGKTSLINAGLNQLLRENNCVPLKVRFNDANMKPLQAVFDGINKTVTQQNLDYEPGEEKTLWQYFKTAAFWSPGDTLLTPVLILDQFEEFFAFHAPEQRKTFITQLADLVNGTIPVELRQSLEPGKPFPYSVHPPSIKILISIREDYLGLLEEMSTEIPDILHRRFKLLPLTREQARQAIIEPAQVEDKQISAGIFRYEPGAVEMMLDFLCKQKKRKGFVTKDVIEDEVESFQLQLLCLHIERKVQQKTDKDAGEADVKKEDLGGEAGMQRVLQNFYHHQLRKLGPIRERRRVWNLFEKGLISATDRRLKLDEEYIESKFKVSVPRLSGLVNCRLLRSEKDERGVYYELSHDALVAPIRKSQYRRKIKIVSRAIFIGCIVLISMLLMQSISSEANEEIKKAEKEYYAALKKDKKDFNAYLKFGRLYYGMNRYDDSKRVFNEAIQNGVENANVYSALSEVFIALEEYNEAIKSLEKAIEINPNFDNAYNDIGYALTNQEKYDEAIKNYRKALEINPKHYMAYRNIGWVLINLEKYDEAIDPLEKAIEINPNDYKAYTNLGSVLINLGKYDEAIDPLEKAIEINPNNDKAYNNLGWALTKQGKYDEAIKNYRKALEINPNDDYAYYSIGWALTKQGKYDEAIESLEKAIEINPNYDVAYNNLGWALTKQEKYDAAIKNYRKALEINPNYDNAYNSIGWALNKLGKYDEAIKNYRKALEINPNDDNAYNLIRTMIRATSNWDGP